MTPRLFAAIALLNVPLLAAGVEAARFHSANRATDAIISSGVRRTFVLHVPAKYDPAKPTPLVISLHGAGLWGATQQSISGWDRVADDEGFIVVYPSALEPAGLDIWHAEKGPLLARDARFIADRIDTLSARYRVDQRRIYADGLSNGGGMAFVLSCTMPNRIAAVGLVGAALTLPFTWCTDTHAVPVMVIHGAADPVTPYNGGRSWVAPTPFPSVPRFVESWAARNRCSPTPSDSAVTAHVVRRSYHGCADRSDVVLYTIQGGGHTWPSGGEIGEWLVGPTNRELDGARALWAFYKAHARNATSRTPR